MLLRVDPRRSTPLFTQLADAVRTEIVADRARPGDRLPSARDVAASLDVNLHTVLHAYQVLRDEGLVQMHRGRGAVVTPAADRLAALHDDILALVARAREAGLSRDALAAVVRAAPADTVAAPPVIPAPKEAPHG